MSTDRENVLLAGGERVTRAQNEPAVRSSARGNTQIHDSDDEPTSAVLAEQAD
jgi:hypothetical protein